MSSMATPNYWPALLRFFFRAIAIAVVIVSTSELFMLLLALGSRFQHGSERFWWSIPGLVGLAVWVKLRHLDLEPLRAAHLHRKRQPWERHCNIWFHRFGFVLLVVAGWNVVQTLSAADWSVASAVNAPHCRLESWLGRFWAGLFFTQVRFGEIPFPFRSEELREELQRS